MKNRQQFNVPMEKDLIDKIKKVARERSFKENKDITSYDLVRDLIKREFDKEDK